MQKSQTLPLNEECVICFHPLHEEKIAIVECGHLYHHRCLKEWLDVSKDKKCPTCRIGRRMIEMHNTSKKNTPCCFFWF